MIHEENFKIINRLENENHRQYAYRTLLYNIMTLHMIPGTPIVEAELCEVLRISRTPIHEAITKLKEESLIDVFPQKGTYVSPISLQNFREGYFLRLTVEPTILKQIQGTISKENSERLYKNLEKQHDIVNTTKDVDEFLRLDNGFHKIIYEIAEKSLCYEAVRSVNSHFDRVRYMDTILNNVDLNRIYQEHKQLYTFLLIGMYSDEEWNHFYEKHVGAFWGKFNSLVERYPEFFDGKLFD